MKTRSRGCLRRHCFHRCLQVFAPFSYDGLSKRKWDLVVVEGFTGTVPAFIHEVWHLRRPERFSLDAKGTAADVPTPVKARLFEGGRQFTKTRS